jgi:hypothetical protein
MDFCDHVDGGGMAWTSAMTGAPLGHHLFIPSATSSVWSKRADFDEKGGDLFLKVIL